MSFDVLCSVGLINPFPAETIIKIFTHLKLCLAAASHNFKWLKITHICLISEQTFANIDV